MGALAANRPRSAARCALVVGAGRSGTTWFASLLADGRTATVFEPMRAERVPAARAAGLDDRSTFLGPNLSAPAVDLLLDALRARVITGWTMRETTPRQLVTSRSIVVKEIRIVRQLPTVVPALVRRGFTRVVLIVRDPVAVVESQIAFNGAASALSTWEVDPAADLVTHDLLEAHPHLEHVAAGVDRTRPHELLAAKWGIDHAVALGGDGYAVVGYDRVRRAPVAEVTALLDTWGWPTPKGLLEAASVSSSVTRRRAPGALDDTQRRRVREIAEACGAVW